MPRGCNYTPRDYLMKISKISHSNDYHEYDKASNIPAIFGYPLEEDEATKLIFLQEPKTERLRSAYISACRATETNPKNPDGEGGVAKSASASAVAADDDGGGEKGAAEDAEKAAKGDT